ncbi:MAG: energy-coupling factor ABC transporter ATP-binding protein [Planctomycetota bacterium]|nr:energy-coupling factor ABC transporter ATP-binding protein [Planctomycetota bacterium]
MADAVIEIRGLEFNYPDGRNALRGVDLAVHAGERVALLGANGAGKSTLLLQLVGILKPKAGSIHVCGLELSRRNVREVRRKLGLVFQIPDDQLFCTTLYDDVAFGPRNLGVPEKEVDSRVAKALRDVGLPGFEDRMAFHLSPGEKKRASIATVLSMDAECLALDEPTSMLDPRARREIGELLKSLPQTQLIVTHDLELARNVCTRAVIMDAGRVVADNGVAELLDDRELLEKHGLA